MKKLLLIPFILLACQPEKSNPLEGTWQLLTGTIVENGKTTVTDYGRDRSFIKVINKTHFTFLLHDLQKDSVRLFSAGGGRYELKGNDYTEHLEYCSDRAWEGHDFHFTIQISGDTLIQSGMEKVDTIERMNTEKYIRLKE
jgi:Lipocalin-like domain